MEFKRVEMAESNVNLVPLMAIITMLIPLLVFTFNFYEVKIVTVGAPRMAGPGAPGAKPEGGDEKKPLNLTVIISDKGFLVKMDPELVPEGAEVRIEKKSFQNSLGESYEEFDYAKLYSKLIELKDKFPKETSINIGAEFGVPLWIIARTMDAARYRLTKDSYENLAEYATAETKLDKDKAPTFTFPNVVFVVVD